MTMHYKVSEIREMDNTALFMEYTEMVIKSTKEENSSRGITNKTANTLERLIEEISEQFGLDVGRIKNNE